MSQQTSNRAFDDLARALAEGSISRRRALKLFAGSAIAALIPSRALAQPKKTIICHKPGTPDEKTIEVSESALHGHQAHGDTLGACGESPTTTTTAAPTTTSTTSTSTSTSTTTPTTSTSTSTTSTSTTPMCLPPGGFCTAGSQCCSGLCGTFGICVCPSGTRSCGGTCVNSTCPPNQKFDQSSCTCVPCVPAGGTCTTSTQCCISSCTNGICCSQSGGFCSTNADCCGSLTCNPPNRQCGLF